jgi:hypothetical protein
MKPQGCPNLFGGGESPRCHRAKNPVDQEARQSQSKRISITIGGQAEESIIAFILLLVYLILGVIAEDP